MPPTEILSEKIIIRYCLTHRNTLKKIAPLYLNFFGLGFIKIMRQKRKTKIMALINGLVMTVLYNIQSIIVVNRRCFLGMSGPYQLARESLKMKLIVSSKWLLIFSKNEC
jgi:hypothetical protein